VPLVNLYVEGIVGVGMGMVEVGDLEDTRRTNAPTATWSITRLKDVASGNCNSGEHGHSGGNGNSDGNGSSGGDNAGGSNEKAYYHCGIPTHISPDCIPYRQAKETQNKVHTWTASIATNGD
jgi:hypothetical protein